nr:bifunctional epoxide hydrolase 2 [Quercus suber]
MQAILDYETRLSIPRGWVNHSISASNPSGAWPKLERGDIPLDAAFFAEFQRDLTDEKRWRAFYAKSLAKAGRADEAAHQVPPVPAIDAEWLYWEMMRMARTPDPHIYPALKRLRAEADRQRAQGDGGLIVAALSNTSIFPAGHPFNDETTPEGRQNRELKGMFDVFVSSAHVGMRKPEEAIYRYAITRVGEWAKYQWPGETGLKAEDFVFLDDIGTNLRTAKRLGMGTIKVQLGRANLAVAELEEIAGLQLSDSKSKL